MGISLNPSTLLSGQGIDVNSLVQQILNQSSGPLTGWQNEQATLQSQASDLNIINSDLSNLATAVRALSDPLGAFTALGATSSDSGVLSASAAAPAVAGTHQIVVNNLASAGLIYTNEFAGGADASILASGVSSAEMDLQIGGAGGTTHAISIAAGSNDTLNTLARYINDQNWGVTASVVTDANGSRLALVSASTGAPSALAITANDTALSFNAPAGGANASLTIDGVPYSSVSNTISGAIAGVTLNLASAAPNSPVQLTVGSDTNQITQAINNFVAAYNRVISDMNQEYTVNASTHKQGPLAADSAVRVLQSSLLEDAAFALPLDSNTGYINLATLGINTNNDGTLTVDSSQLSSVLSSNPAAVQNFFQNASATGFADSFNKNLTSLTDSTAGPISVDLAQNKIQQQNLADNISNFELLLQSKHDQLTKQFSQVSAALQAYPLLLQQVTATLATLDTNSNGTSSH